ncbi:hypothetical protein NDI45_24810 [Leptolyngbya sp. GB1-A1]|uniref:hypothetical protein n=1 Tax=Leptolyngbya sp. GB1-A1 TaxID=2933908 RepID=UPI00329A6C52
MKPVILTKLLSVSSLTSGVILVWAIDRDRARLASIGRVLWVTNRLIGYFGQNSFGRDFPSVLSL